MCLTRALVQQGGTGEALAGGKAGAAEPEAIMAGGAGEGEAGVGELEAPKVGSWGGGSCSKCGSWMCLLQTRLFQT